MYLNISDFSMLLYLCFCTYFFSNLTTSNFKLNFLIRNKRVHKTETSFDSNGRSILFCFKLYFRKLFSS